MSRVRKLVAGLTALFMLSGCWSAVTETRRERVVVTTEPEGLTVWQEDGLRRRIVGASPVEAFVEEREEKRRFRRAWWTVPALMVPVMIGGGVLIAENIGDHYGGPGVWAGAIMLGASGLVFLASAGGCAIGEALDGDVLWSEHREAAFRSSLDGRTATARRRPIPRAGMTRLHLDPGATSSPTGGVDLSTRPQVLVPAFEDPGATLGLIQHAALRHRVATMIDTSSAFGAILEDPHAAATHTLRVRIAQGVAACPLSVELFERDRRHPASTIQMDSACHLPGIRASLDKSIRLLMGWEVGQEWEGAYDGRLDMPPLDDTTEFGWE